MAAEQDSDPFSDRHPPSFWHDESMPKQPLTVELEKDVIMAARAEASRKGQSEAAVIEQALREHLSAGSSVTDRVWVRNQAYALSEDKACALVGKGCRLPGRRGRRRRCAGPRCLRGASRRRAR